LARKPQGENVEAIEGLGFLNPISESSGIGSKTPDYKKRKHKGMTKQGKPSQLSVSSGFKDRSYLFFLAGAFFFAGALFFAGAFFFTTAFLFAGAFFFAGALFLGAAFFLGLAFSAALAFFSCASKVFALAFVAVSSLLSFANFFFACPNLNWICLAVAILSPFLSI
jgi:hypothetical protein